MSGRGTALTARSNAGLSDAAAKGPVGEAGHVPLGCACCTSKGLNGMGGRSLRLEG